ncbi:unnamed protein product, partial [Lymnaea stagnalis]
MVPSSTWTINHKYISGLQVTMKRATTDDSGTYVCQGYFTFGMKTKIVNITQEVVIKPKPPPVASKSDPGNNTLSPSAIAGIVIPLVCAVVLCRAAWYLLKNKREKGKELLAYLSFKWKVSPVVRYFQTLCRKIDRRKKAAELTVAY